MFQQPSCHDTWAGCLGCLAHSDGEVDELISEAGSFTDLLEGVGEPPRRRPVSDRARATWTAQRPGPAGAWRREEQDVELPVPHSSFPAVLGCLVQEVVLASSIEDVHFIDDQADTLLDSELAQLLAYRRLPRLP